MKDKIRSPTACQSLLLANELSGFNSLIRSAIMYAFKLNSKVTSWRR